MNTAISRIKQIFRRFNEKEHIYDDFLRIARRERINLSVYKMPEVIRGYYVSERRRVYRKKWIVFNESVTGIERVYVAFHELVHHFLHAKFTSKETFYCRLHRLEDSRQDAEAEAIALMLMIPQRKLLQLRDTPFDEIHEYTPEMLIKRQRLYEQLEAKTKVLFPSWQ